MLFFTGLQMIWIDKAMNISLSSVVAAASVSTASVGGVPHEITGGNRQEKLAQLMRQFESGGLYLRTVSDHRDEFENTFMPKLDACLGRGCDERYWSSATFIQQGLNGKVHDPHADRTGLIISADARLGGFSTFDAATANVPSGLEPSQYFPSQFPKFDMMGAYQATWDEDIFSVDATAVSEQQMDELGIPDEYRSVFDFDRIQEKMAQPRLAGREVEPTEAKICYQPKDVLGIYVDVDSPASQSKARELQQAMREQGFDLPFIAYRGGAAQELASV
ncbi:hypothetical protein VL04_09385 [Chromobacterium violaceum]|uniref:NAD(+)--protein-threonine ADP-ribosyltransferase n=1 Tax=Chromobacterium violaceum TaxID=536 RepID=UPI0006539347|nr:hypothetical protein [Chromobacterium violaceum]KMN48178.1 hypothetical protein VK93_17220 [Chromobacterium violaceum]KMN84527.1 hypothetical protein VL02_19215 [Chromobacterium violaceum]KMN90516.1 hypothetical protein VL04_09385 [Chromobacterium violaceum]KMO02561.1 hypothetical protein VL16_18240 [Chromobacterium violaceum]